MFDVSVESALSIASLSYLLGLSASLIIYVKYSKSQKGLISICLYYFLSFVGMVLIFFRPQLTTFLSVILANVLLFLGRMFLARGIFVLSEFKTSKWSIPLMSVVYSALFVYFLYINENVLARILIYTGFAIAVHSYIIYQLIMSKTVTHKQDLLIPINILMVVNFLVRFVRSIFVSPESQNFLDYYSDSMSIIMIGLLSVVVIAGIFSLITNNYTKALETSIDKEKAYSSIYQHSPIPILACSVNGDILHANDSLLTFLSVTFDELKEKGWKQFVSKEDSEQIRTVVKNLDFGESNKQYQISIQLEEEVVPVELTLKKSSKGDMFEGYIEDLTEKHEFLNRLEDITLQQQTVLKNIPGFAYRCLNDDDWTMLVLSDSFTSITGYEKDEVLHNRDISFNTLIVPEHREKVKRDWEVCVREKTKYIGEYQIVRKDGTLVWVWEQGESEYDDEGDVIQLTGFISDISYRKDVEFALEFLSYHDSMTGLYNRRFVEAELKRLDVDRNVPFSIMKLDIDGLKFANDVFGHSYGDDLIKKVSIILKETLRQDEIIGRMGGDEFMVLLPRTTTTQLQVIIDRLLVRFDQANMKTKVSVSIGGKTKEDASVKIDKVIHDAEEEMYSNKLFKKPIVSQEAVEAILKILYDKYPYEESNVNKIVNLAHRIGKHLNFSVVRLEKLEQAAKLSRVGLITDNRHTPKDCEYLPEDAYRIVKAIPTYSDIANILIGVCEHYDGGGHPNGYMKDMISTESQIIGLSLFLVLHDYEELSGSDIKAILDDKSGQWFNPMLVTEYYRMVD